MLEFLFMAKKKAKSVKKSKKSMKVKKVIKTGHACEFC
jgi:hypothetical protein